MRLLDKMDCECIPAIYSGNKEADNKANTELYLKLVKEGEEKGFCPVLIDKDIMHYIYEPHYGFTESKEDYPKITRWLIQSASNNCFSVWLGRLIYNYYLEGIEYEDDVINDLERLNPPIHREYIEKFSKFNKIKNLLLVKMIVISHMIIVMKIMFLH